MSFRKVNGHEVDTDRRLGGGKYGDVFLGRNSETKTIVAAKRVWVDEDDKEEVEDVMKEVKVLEKIPPHKNIVSFLGTEQTDECLWIFQTYCNAADLNKFCLHNNVDLCDKMHILTECAAAIVHLHGLDPAVVHRDLKRENILIAKEKDTTTVKLCDFGVSRVASRDTSGATVYMGTFCGTGEFMSPELFPFERGTPISYKKSVDIFSMGLVCVALIEAPAMTKLHAMAGKKIL